MPSLSDAAIDGLVGLMEAAPSGHSTIDLWLNGGQMSAVPAEATGFGPRDPGYLLSPEANWEHPADDAANIAWAREVLASVASEATGGSYLNFPGMLEEGAALIRDSFGPTYDRLAELKRSTTRQRVPPQPERGARRHALTRQAPPPPTHGGARPRSQSPYAWNAPPPIIRGAAARGTLPRRPAPTTTVQSHADP